MKDLDALEPGIRDKARAFTAALRAAGIAHAVIETRRSLAVQSAYYAQGREPLISVNALRAATGLWAITDAENRNTITRTMRSKHLEGKAFDLVPLDQKGRAWWSAPPDVWLTIGELGESFGLTWGGRWGAAEGKLGWDCPHYEED